MGDTPTITDGNRISKLRITKGSNSHVSPIVEVNQDASGFGGATFADTQNIIVTSPRQDFLDEGFSLQQAVEKGKTPELSKDVMRQY